MNKSILIVEDEILIAQQLKKIITNHGYQCAGIAISYDKAVELLKNETIDLVLLDVNISGNRSGIEVAQHINERYRIPFLFLTSYTDITTLDEVKSCRPNGYLSKPVNKATLLTNLDIILAQTHEEQTKSFKLHVGNTSYAIDFAKLLYVKSTHVYVELHFTDQKIVVRISLKDLLTKMQQGEFISINRSFAINQKKLRKRKGAMVHVEDHVFKVSKNYIASFEA
jgi:DNA-binding LytR/AlgR family response regulator